MRHGPDTDLIALVLPSNAATETAGGKRRRNPPRVGGKSPTGTGTGDSHSVQRWCCSECQDDMAAGKGFVVNENEDAL